jgi:hypothetical protein
MLVFPYTFPRHSVFVFFCHLVSLLRRLKPKNNGRSQLGLDTGSYLNHSFALYRHFNNDTNSEISWYNIYRHLYCNDRKNTLKDLVNFVKSVPINYPKTSPGVDYFPISLPTKIPGLHVHI